MELLQIAKLPVEALRFIGHQLTDGGWSNLPPLPQGEIVRPVRASVARHAAELTVPDNIYLGQE